MYVLCIQAGNIILFVTIQQFTTGMNIFNNNSNMKYIKRKFYRRFIKSNTNRKKQAYYIIHGITSLEVNNNGTIQL